MICRTATTSKTTQLAAKTLDPIQRVRFNPKSLRCTINAQCYECIYDKSDVGSWRQQVQLCPSTDCPLYQVRPTSSAVINALDESANDKGQAA